MPTFHSSNPKQRIMIPYYLAFIVFLFVLIELIYLIYEGIEHTKKQVKWVNHTQEVLNKAKNILSLLTDTETGKRGFLLSNDSSFLEPYRLAVPFILDGIQDLKYLTKDNTSQQKHIDALRGLAVKRIENAQSGIFDAPKLRSDAKAMYQSIAEGKEAMDTIRKLIKGIIQDEENLLEERLAAYQQSNDSLKSRVFLLLFSLVSIAVIFGIYMYKQLGVIHYYQENLKEANEELETNNQTIHTLNEELLANNKELSAANEEIKVYSEELETNNEQLLQANQLIKQQSEMLVRQSEEKLNQILKFNRDVIWSASPDTQELYFVSPAVEQIYGITPEENYKEPELWFKAVYPEDRAILEKAIEKLNRDYYHETEYRIIDRKGKIRWVLDRAYKILNDKNEVIRLNGVIMDISEKKKIELEIIRQKELLAEAQQIAKLANWEWDLSKNQHHWSDEMFRIYEVGKETFENTNWQDFKYIHPEDVERVQAMLENINKEKEKVEFEYRIITPTGKLKHIKCIFLPDKFNELGKLIRLKGVLQDISQQKINEIQLKKTLQDVKNFREAINQSACVMINDLQGNISFINKTLCEISGYVLEEVLGKNIYEVNLGAGHPKQHLDLIRQEIAKKNYWRGEIQSKSKNGTAYWLDVTISPIKDENGKIFQFLNLAYLITDRKKAEEENQQLIQQLIQQNNDLQKFSFMISHNLRAPVANILGLVSLMNKGVLDKDNLVYVEHLEKSAQRMDEVTHDLNKILELKDLIDKDKEIVNLDQMLRSIKQSLQSQIKESKAVIKQDFSQVSEIFTIKSYLDSILYNLISNALKYKSPEHKPLIQILVTKQAGYICIMVKDNGLGLDLEKFKEKIFMLYQRFHLHIEGRGIGLYLVKTQAEALGGRVEVESSLGEGTTFKVFIKLKP